MKIPLIFFKAIYLILIISITIIPHTEGFKKPKLSVASGSCFTNLDAVDNQITPCSPFDLIIDANTCPQGAIKIGKYVTAFTGTVIPPDQVTLGCLGGSRFCCAQLLKYTPPTPTPPCLQQIIVDGVQGYYKIDAVWCKPMF